MATSVADLQAELEAVNAAIAKAIVAQSHSMSTSSGGFSQSRQSLADLREHRNDLIARIERAGRGGGIRVRGTVPLG